MSIVLFINGALGLRVLEYVSGLTECRLSVVVLNSVSKRSSNYLEEVESILDAKNLDLPILEWHGEIADSAELDFLFKGVDFGVSALFGHILPKGVVGKFPGGVLNMHPSLLPIGRGADPIPWGIIERQKHGVTLHLMDQNLDTGDIVFQKEITTDCTMNAGEIYEIAVSELFSVFSRLFVSWINDEIEPRPQSKSPYSQHKSRDLDLLKIINDNEVGTFGDFVRRMQAISFSNGSLPKYMDSEGKIWEITIKIQEPSNNEQESV